MMYHITIYRHHMVLVASWEYPKEMGAIEDKEEAYSNIGPMEGRKKET